jgi:carbohydrate-selective porin OprB
VTALRVAARLVPIALSVLAALPAYAAAGAFEPPRSGFDLKFDGESYANLSGGFQRGSEGNAVVDAQSTPADQDIGLGDSGAWYLDLKHIQGADPSASLTGDVQVASNIEAPAANRVYEFWYEHLLFERTFGVRAGIVDLNRYFDAVPGSAAIQCLGVHVAALRRIALTRHRVDANRILKFTSCVEAGGTAHR